MPHFASALLVGPYMPDANTLVLLHLDEAAGGSVTTNVGSLGGNFISVNFSSDTTPLPVLTTMLGGVSYSTNSTPPISFNNCMTNTTGGYELGYDYNRDGVFEPDPGGGGASGDFIVMTNLNIGNGGQTPFTLEALVQPTNITNTEEIICTDSSQANRAFQFRIESGSLQFQFILNSQVLTDAIPTTGSNAFTAANWYHAAFTYDGTNGTFYWTKLGPSRTAASVLLSGPLTMGTADGVVVGPLVVGNRGRPTGTETFLGRIDEVRISNMARAATGMLFPGPNVSIVSQPSPTNQLVGTRQPFGIAVTANGQSMAAQWLGDCERHEQHILGRFRAIDRRGRLRRGGHE